MLATSNSGPFVPRARGYPWGSSERRLSRVLAIVLLGLVLPLLPPALLSAETNSSPSVDRSAIVHRTENIFNQARRLYLAETNNVELAWQFGRACFDWADCSTRSAQRAAIAQEGIAACRNAIVKDPGSVPSHYYLAMDQGQLAQTKELSALWLVDQMETEFKLALSLDPNFDYAGPDRNLGLLYLDAPGWPASIGNNAKARLHLQEALKIAPRYPENLLNLIDAEIQWGERGPARHRLRTLDELWPSAQREFAGDQWIASWLDWEKRRTELRAKAGESESPHSSSKK